MSQTSLGGSFGSNSADIGEKTAEQRTDYLTNKQGDAVGMNYTVPKGDFAHLLGFKPPTAQELAGKEPVTGRRAIEVSLQNDFRAVGLGAARNGGAYRNQFVALGAFDNKPGREKDMLKDGLDSIKASMQPNATEGGKKQSLGEMAHATPYQVLLKQEQMAKSSHNENLKMMEMQYKMQALSKEEGTLSNLMKVRHDAISRVIRGNGQ